MNAKCLLFGAALGLTAAAASAQYCPTAVGTVLNYVETVSQPESIVKNITLTADSIYTENGQTVVRLLDHTDIRGSLKTEADSYVYAYYNASDAQAPTQYILLNADQLKELMATSVREELASNGQNISESDMNEVLAMIRPSGKLALTLDPAAAPDTKIPNTSLRVNISTMSISMHISNGKVLGKESITVEAGTFDDCLKVSYVLKNNMPGESVKSYITDWYAPGIGLVRQEAMDKNGQVQYVEELKSVVRP